MTPSLCIKLAHFFSVTLFSLSLHCTHTDSSFFCPLPLSLSPPVLFLLSSECNNFLSVSLGNALRLWDLSLSSDEFAFSENNSNYAADERGE